MVQGKTCSQCDRKHHSSLHESKAAWAEANHVSFATDTCKHEVVLMETEMIEVTSLKGAIGQARVLDDSASSVTLCRAAWAEELQFESQPHSI